MCWSLSLGISGGSAEVTIEAASRLIMVVARALVTIARGLVMACTPIRHQIGLVLYATRPGAAYAAAVKYQTAGRLIRVPARLQIKT